MFVFILFLSVGSMELKQQMSVVSVDGEYIHSFSAGINIQTFIMHQMTSSHLY